jgi:hypothetical protein
MLNLFQWARIVLIVERGVNPMERLKYQQQYSEPMTDGGRALVLRLNFTVSLSFVALRDNKIECLNFFLKYFFGIIFLFSMLLIFHPVY